LRVPLVVERWLLWSRWAAIYGHHVVVLPVTLLHGGRKPLHAGTGWK